MLGLVGYAWQIRIGWAWIWKIVRVSHLVGLIIWTPFWLYIGLPLLPTEPSLRWALVGLMSIGITFPLFKVYVLFRYAFREDEMWNPATAD